MKNFLHSYMLHLWCVVTILTVLLFEQVWIPYSSDKLLSERIEQFHYSLQVSSLLVEAKQTEQGQKTLLNQLNAQGRTQGWLAFVYDDEQSLRQQASKSKDKQLLLLNTPDTLNTANAYALWFKPSDIIAKQQFVYRIIEIIFIALFSFVFIVIWRKQQSFVKSLREIATVTKFLAVGRFETAFPTVKNSSILTEIIDTFEVTRKALLTMKLDLQKKGIESEAKDQRLYNSHQVASLGCWEWQVVKDEVWFSDSIQAILGLGETSRKIGIQDFLGSVHSSDKKALIQRLLQPLQANDVIATDFRISVAGKVRHIQLLAKAQEHRDKTIRLNGTCQDITERKEIESLLQKLSSAITASGSGVMITDVIGLVEYINPKFTQTTGYLLEDLAGTTSIMLSRECLAEDEYDSVWKEILAGRGWRGDLENIRKDGSAYWSSVSISPINNEYDELTHFVIVSEDVSELKDAHARMEQLTLYDELTGLPNRRFFLRKLERLLSTKVMEAPAVVMLLDLDNFKTVNDTQGHPAGDKLLVDVAHRLEKIMPSHGLAARLGGDEFAILISQVKDIKQVNKTAQTILDTIAKPFVINSNEIKVSTSIGLAWLPKDGNQPDVILKHADLAMYQAKEMGRNQYRQFTQQLNEQLQRYIRFSRELPEALANGDFKLFFQPKVDLKANKIIGVEALIRWQHPELGPVSPLDFISIAENTGFIVPLGNWVFAEACRNMKSLKDSGLAEISCAVNISLRQFKAPSLLGVIEKSIRDNKLDPKLFEVEITESLLMEDVEQSILTLKDIQKLGIRVAIDDFGTGYSSFSYLKNLPINVLKIDRCFIKDIPQSVDDIKITSAIISMAHSLNLKVVAEGIETVEQQDFLIEQQCDIGQGYFFGKPMSLDELKKVLENNE